MRLSTFTTLSYVLFFLVVQAYPNHAQAQAQKEQPRIIQDSRYKSAVGHHRRASYSKALEVYRAMLQTGKNLRSIDSLLLQRRIAECELGLQKQSNPEPVTVTKLDQNINDPRYTSLGAFAMNDERTLYFTSPRPKSAKAKGSSDGLPDNVCVSRRATGSSPWGKVTAIKYSQLNQGVLGISTDSKNMFIFSGSNDIFVQELDQIAREIKFVPIDKALNLNIDKRFHVSSLAMTSDRQTIYLCANDEKVQGGYGSHDIWSISRNPDTNEWGEMVNLGEEINTEGEEFSVSILPDGKTLFFASDGHKGLGRCDIYRSTYVDSLGVWSKPLHLGYPINTPNNDLYYNPVFDSPNHAYYSVERPDASGLYDVYFIDYQGEILSIEEQDARRRAAEAAEAQAQKEAKQREYLAALQQIEATPIKPAEAAIMAQKGYSAFPKDSASAGMKILLRNVQFAKGGTGLTPESSKYLEPLYRLLEMQPHIRVRISGHTDNTGKPAVNLAISKERARSVVNFLVKKGINAARLESGGYGQTQPIAPNTTESGRIINRRVEFVVIK
ncbi:MAG: OmpA family protein [Prevotellaceae bacterium]|jgi:outer membrane protein OmpA-like peptidoglycan-associated protein|nr:OmpA family protein [Prevotellaceae bacterium]